MKTYKFIDGIHACMVLSVNAPNDPGPEYVLADEAMDSYKSGRDKGWNDGYHEGQVELASCISAKDARIAELTAEVYRLRLLVKEAYEEGVSDTDAAEEGRWEESHARNALKDGV